MFILPINLQEIILLQKESTDSQQGMLKDVNRVKAWDPYSFIIRINRQYQQLITQFTFKLSDKNNVAHSPWKQQPFIELTLTPLIW